MKILKIGLKNLNSLRLDTVVDFSEIPLRDAGLFAIVGDTGAGKTTILDALTLGLYGRVHRNKDEAEVLSFGTVDGHAEVEFLVKEKVYRAKWVIWRSRGKLDGKIHTKRELAEWNPKKEVFVILAEKKRDINEKVEEITGLDYERFSKSVLLSQGDFAAFLKAGNKERSNLLERITGTEIYSQISIAAFRKHKEEELKVSELKKELDALQILDSTSLNNLKKELSELAKEGKNKQKTINTLQIQIQWRNRLAELTAQKAEFSLGLESALDALETAAPDFARLDRHQSTLIFQKELTKLESLEQQQIDLKEEADELQRNSQKYQQEQDDFNLILQEITLQLNNFKSDKVHKEKLFQKVNALDVKLEEKNIPFQEIKNEKAEIDAQITDSQLNIKSAETKFSDSKILLEKIKDWLKVNNKYKTVGEALPALRNLLSDWSEYQEQQKTLSIELKEIEENLSISQGFISEFDEKLTHEKVQLNFATTNFNANFFSDDAGNRGKLLEQLNQQMEQLDSQTKNLKMLIDLNEDYQTSIVELTKYDEEIHDLENKRGLIETRLLTAIENEEALKKRYDYKFQMLEREKLFANYDRERANLVEGDQCPLCFSTTHPFRHIKDYKPYVNEAEADYLAVKAQWDLMKKETQRLIFRQNEIGNQIYQIIGEQEKNLDGKRDLILQRIKSAEKKIASIARELKEEKLYNTTKGDVLRQKLISVKNNLLTKRKVRSDLIALDQQIIQQEKAIATLQQDYNAEKINQASLVASLKSGSQKLEETNKKQRKLKQKIDKEIKVFGFNLDSQSADSLLIVLDQKRKDFEKATSKLAEQTTELALTDQSLQQLFTQQKDLNRRATTIHKQLDKLQSEITELETKRTNLFGIQSVEIVRNQLNQQLQITETSLEAKKQESKEAEILLKSELAKAKKNGKDLEKIGKQLGKQHNHLLKIILPKGFVDVADLKAANLDLAEVKQLETTKNTLQKQLTQSQQSLKNTNKELEKVSALALTTETIETLFEKQEAAKVQLQFLQQESGKINHQIEDNERREATSKELIKKMDIQQKEFRRWARLKDIIGSADGKVFRAFAQGLTLKKLSDLANRHLSQLHGRYLIHKPNDKDLTLEIVDTHQANNIRSIHTLSGGESFLVSLALALGLSDLAGRNTQINSLFIDEGFGTLDESALDLAISTLENLQSKGKRIGVISHVFALKERISTQIQIQKSGSGFSKVEIVG